MAVLISWEFLFILALTGSGMSFFLVGSNFLAVRSLKRRSLERFKGVSDPGWKAGFQKALALKTNLDDSLSRILEKGIGAGLVRIWLESGLGEGPLSLLAVFGGVILGGFYLTYALTERTLLGVFSGVALAAGVISVISYRAAFQRRRFEDQFPDLVERLADSLQAGYTLPQAVHFVGPNLLEPSSAEMIRVGRMLSFGVPLAEALRGLHSRHPSEDLKLLIEILKLHQKVGGDIVKMIRELAAVVRERSELEKDIRTLTAQGRLSAVVITLLVPVSLVILAFFPGYIDVLFQTTPGNLVLMTAVILDGLGALIVRKLIQVEV